MTLLSTATSRRGIARNSVINLLGQIIPLAVAIFAVPRLIHGMGVERFGILSLAWLVAGYFSLFDLGLGRALTQLVAERLPTHSAKELNGLVWTALVLMAVMGIFGGVLAAAMSPWLSGDVFRIPAALHREAFQTFLILSACIPVVVITSGLSGVLVAYHRFDLVNLVRIPLGVSNYLLPVALLAFSNNLVPIIWTLVASRLLSGLIQLFQCFHIMSGLRQGPYFVRSAVRPLFRFGGWMTVSNVVGPVMMYMDRFFIGAVVSVAAVAYYATPYEMVTKMLIIPNAIVASLFPIFASSYATDRQQTKRLLALGWKYVFMLVFPTALAVIALSHLGLTLWLGGDFADHSTTALQWLSAGVFINSIGQILFALVQGAGRPDLTAKLHLLEVVIYVPLLLLCLKLYGIEGAAAAWALRVALDNALLMLIGKRLLPGEGSSMTLLAWVLAAASAAFMAVALATNPYLKSLLVLACAAALLYFGIKQNLLPAAIWRQLRSKSV